MSLSKITIKEIPEANLKRSNRITIQKWSITNWLNSQRKKTLPVVEKSTEIESPKEDLTTIECECDHSYDTDTADEITTRDDSTFINSDLSEYIRKKSIEWKCYPKELIDTHCHFDMLFKR